MGGGCLHSFAKNCLAATSRITLTSVPWNTSEDVTEIQPTRVCATGKVIAAQGLGLAGSL
ncbi:hypothetical protein AGR8A_Lc10408 [Agrobacterium fabrum str. J-07]|nr:hypothetical protein AGR8A_Lc10408 [Agrobacterium fabrum str. J-07]